MNYDRRGNELICCQEKSQETCSQNRLRASTRMLVGWVRRSPRVRTRSFDLECPATGYRHLKRIVLSVVSRENSKSRCRRRCDEGAEM